MDLRRCFNFLVLVGCVFGSSLVAMAQSEQAAGNSKDPSRVHRPPNDAQSGVTSIIGPGRHIEFTTNKRPGAPAATAAPGSKNSGIVITGAVGLGGLSNFAVRLNQLHERIQLGTDKGWITAEAAARFRGEYSRLMTAEEAWRTGGKTREAGDDLERQINTLSYDISQDMVSNPAAPVAPKSAENRDTPVAPPVDKDDKPDAAGE